MPLLATLLCFCSAEAGAQEAGAPAASTVTMGPVWPRLSPAEQASVMSFGEDFKRFMAKAKSEMTFVREAVTFGEANGFKPWSPAIKKADLKPGSRWYAINRDRTIVLFVMGTEPMSAGVRIVNTHIDAVRIELKPKPFRISFDVPLLDTQVHGGLKNYQWVNRPLALIGRIDKTDGSTVWVDIGNAPGDPTFIIPDLAPHVDRDFLERKNREVIQTEELDPLLALTADAAMKALDEKYHIGRDDFLAGELQLVPAQMPVDVGLDRQLVAAYGHDDRSNGFASLRAIADLKVPRRTALAYAVNNEEVSSWSTGVDSEWFRTLLAEIISAEQQGSYNDLMLRESIGRSQVLVSDCTTAINPLFPQPQIPDAAARLGWGLVFKDYGSGRQGHSEYFAQVRRIFDDAGVHWQTHSYKAGYGGGTIAQWFANANMDAIDVGIGILSMHSPMDISAKVDLWELYRGFAAFLGSAANPTSTASR